MNEWMRRAGLTLGRVAGEGLFEEVAFNLIQEEREGDCWEGSGKERMAGPRDVNFEKEEKAWYV